MFHGAILLIIVPVIFYMLYHRNSPGHAGRIATESASSNIRLTSKVEDDYNLISWAFSGTYDEDKPVLIDAERPSRYLSRKTAHQLVARLAGSFEPGGTICIHLPNDITYPVLFLGIVASGCSWTGTNPAYTSTELKHHFVSSGTSCVITSDEYLKTVQNAVDACTHKIEIILFRDILSAQNLDDSQQPEDLLVPRLRTLHDLLKQNSDAICLQVRLANVSSGSTAAIMSTSGTTGLPKMVKRTHRMLILETKSIDDDVKLYEIRRLYCTPIFHAFSFPEMVINSLRLGFPSFYMKRFDDTFAQKISHFKVTETMVAPPILLRLSDRAMDNVKEASMIQSLRMLLCAGAPLSAELRERFLRLFTNTPRLVQVWGMSEGGWFATFKNPEHDETGSVGRPIAGYQVRVSFDQRASLGYNDKVGELLIKGPQMARGYMNNDKATAESFDEEGWLRTGDIGYMSDGKIYLVDRVKDMIKVNGWSVSPAELEAALYRHPKVLDSAVLGAGLDIEEHPVAFVVLKEPGLSSTDILNHLGHYVSRFKIAKCEVIFVTAIPRNASGKILRKELRQQLEQKL